MWLRRLLALALAVGLVLGAMQLRARLSGGGVEAPDDVRIACAAELGAVCEALDVTPAPLVEQASATVDRFAEPDLPFDVWLTLEPWPTLAADARARAGASELATERSAVLARSPAVIVADTERAAAMEPMCAGPVTWRCLAEQADVPWADIGGRSQWGRVKIGLDRPEQRAGGLLTLAAATASYFEGDYNSRSLESPDYFAWLSDLAAAVEAPADQSPFERMLLTGAAEYEFAGALEANVVPVLQRAQARARQLEILHPEPAVTADVVVVGYDEAGRAAVAQVTEQVRAPLADNDWRVPGAETPSELASVALPQDNGLPSAAALEALRRTWDEVTR